MKEEILDKLLKDEGEYSNNPKDSGGETIYGVTKKNYPEDFEEIYSAYKVDKTKAVTLAKQFYLREFYNPLYDKLKDRLAEKIFSLSVNMGKKKVVEFLQEVLNAEFGKSIEVDGKFGKDTLEKCLTVYHETLRSALIIRTKFYYDSIVKKNPKNKDFYWGWMNRLFS